MQDFVRFHNPNYLHKPDESFFSCIALSPPPVEDLKQLGVSGIAKAIETGSVDKVKYY